VVILCFSRVHVTRATMEQLNGRFSVEPGNGGTREGYLADHKVETFLIIHPSETNVSSLFRSRLIQIILTSLFHYYK